MSSYKNKVSEDVRKLTQLLKENTQNESIQYKENEELHDYLSAILNKEREKQANAILVEQNKQTKQNLTSQIDAIKRYDSKIASRRS